LRPFTGSPFAQIPWVKPGRKKLSAMLRSVGWKNGNVATSERLPGTPVYPPVSVRPLLKRQPMLPATTIEAAPAEVQTVRLYCSFGLNM
jgi:hypothetical protein